MDAKKKEILRLLRGLPDDAVEKIAIFIAGMRAQKGLPNTPPENDDKKSGSKDK